MIVAASERAVLGTIIDSNGSDLPPFVARLVENSPESFSDPRLGAIASAIRALRAEGRAISPSLLLPALAGDDTGAALLLGTLSDEAIGLDLIEGEALPIWQAYSVRRAASVGRDLADAISATPEQAAAIIAGARRALDDLDTERFSGTPYVARGIGEIETPSDHPDLELLRHRFLCRGAGLLLAAPSGVGKSTFALQAMLCFGAGRDCFGLSPTKPLRSIYVQAENDNGDLAELRDGILAGLEFTLAERELALSNVSFATVDDLCGQAFLRTAVEPLLRDTKPDLLWIDPLLSYLGGDVSRQDIVSPWLRNCLNPILHRHGVACVLIHHTNKPSSGKEKPDWRAGDFAYIGSGSAELANWPRAVVAIVSTGSHDVFELRLGKRGSRVHWRNPDGTTSYSRFIAHGRDGIYWREADESEQPATSGRKIESSVEDILNLLDGGMKSADWQRVCRNEAGISERSFYRLKNAAEKSGRINRSKIDQKWFKNS